MCTYGQVCIFQQNYLYTYNTSKVDQSWGLEQSQKSQDALTNQGLPPLLQPELQVLPVMA